MTFSALYKTGTEIESNQMLDIKRFQSSHYKYAQKTRKPWLDR